MGPRPPPLLIDEDQESDEHPWGPKLGTLGSSLVHLVTTDLLRFQPTSEKATATHPVLLPGKSHGWQSLVGCSPWGRTESDATEAS